MLKIVRKSVKRLSQDGQDSRCFAVFGANISHGGAGLTTVLSDNVDRLVCFEFVDVVKLYTKDWSTLDNEI